MVFRGAGARSSSGDSCGRRLFRELFLEIFSRNRNSKKPLERAERISGMSTDAAPSVTVSAAAMDDALPADAAQLRELIRQLQAREAQLTAALNESAQTVAQQRKRTPHPFLTGRLCWASSGSNSRFSRGEWSWQFGVVRRRWRSGRSDWLAFIGRGRASPSFAMTRAFQPRRFTSGGASFGEGRLRRVPAVQSGSQRDRR